MNKEFYYKPKINNFKYKRSKKIEEKYLLHKQKLKEKNISIQEHILNTIIKDNLFKITKNRFPYDIDNIKHYLIWINPKYKISYETIYQYIKFKLGTSYFYYFENSSDLKSILGIRHFHIFIFK